MASIPTEDRSSMTPITADNLAYKMALDSVMQRRADQLSDVRVTEQKYVPIQMEVIASRPGLPTFGVSTITIDMPEQYMPGYEHMDDN